MKYLNITGLALIYFTILITSCDLADRSLELDPHDSKLVLDAQLFQGDTTQLIILSKSIGITDTLFSEEINQPLPGSGITLITPDQGAISGYIYRDASPFATVSAPLWKFDYSDFIAGEAYTVEGVADDLEPISATSTVPPNPTLSEINVILADTNTNNFFIRDKWEITIDDAADQENFYMIEADHVFFEDQFENRNKIRFYDIPNNPIDESFIENRVSVISDKNFNGTMYKFIVYGERPKRGNSEIQFKLYQITEDHYKYLSQYERYNNDNPFSEPVTFHNNIADGYGIFSITSKPVLRTIEI